MLDQIPPTLVDLALWIADYYGTTPARALELVAPRRREPRGERPSPVERESLPGEVEPDELTPEQEAAIARIVAGLDDAGAAHLLLVGPTGSGKTEVYLQACEAALERGLGTIVLVPEIALAPQTVGRFRQRFGDTVAILHSALGQAERRDERDRIARGEARIVVGARSAIFAPMRDVGLVIVDEEHDSSYKQESDPRYDARTVAAKRAALEGAVAVYGSATPRPESWATLERVGLSVRIGAPMPRVRLVDLRREPGYPLSAPLLAELGRIAEHGGKAILLLNRRGVTPAIHCRACGLSRRCPNCDVALTLHARRRPPLPSLRRTRSRVPETCPACGSAELAQHRRRDAAARDGARAATCPSSSGSGSTPTRPPVPAPSARRSSAFAHADRAVLIGTQMVAKGHHFPGVDLAAVVDADTGLALPDFRAEERTFQLVTQLAGRSGRDAPGLVLVQTFQPDAMPLQFAHATTSPGSSRRSSSGARRSAIRRSATSSRSSPPGPTRRRAPQRAAGGARRPRGPRGDAARPGAAPAPAGPAPRPARRQDRRAARARAPGGAPPRGRRARAAAATG